MIVWATSCVMVAAALAMVGLAVWVNDSLVAEKRAADRQAQIERADYMACAAELADLRRAHGARGTSNVLTGPRGSAAVRAGGGS